MPITSQPADLPEWASDETNVIEPTSLKKASGFVVEKPAHQTLNWVLWENYKWTEYFKNYFDTISNTNIVFDDSNQILKVSQGHFQSEKAGTNTTQTNDSNARIVVRNTDGTANNFADISFANQNNDITAKVSAQYVNHTNKNTDLSFFAADSSGNLIEYARIFGDGFFQVNTRFRSDVDTTSIAFHVNNASTTGEVLRIEYGGNAVGDTTNFAFRAVDGISTVRAQMTRNGDWYNFTGTYGTISDISLKENITNARSYLDDICKLRLVNYGLKSEPGSKYLGFIAQETKEIFPGIVSKTNLIIKGKETEVLTVKESIFTKMLIGCIQDLKVIIDKQESRIKKLESKI